MPGRPEWASQPYSWLASTRRRYLASHSLRHPAASDSSNSKSVTATASSKEKLDKLLAMPSGATHVVNYKTEDFAAEVKKTTGGKGANVVIDFVGQSHWHQNIDALAVDGRMTLLATLSGMQNCPLFSSPPDKPSPTGGEVPKMDIRPILYKRLRIQGSTLRSRTQAYQGDLVAQ